jgi:uncharacterized repeat protein (TIGR01451 family)
VISEFELNALPYTVEEWVEIRIDVDLDADTQSIYYGGQLLSTKSWTEGVSGLGIANIGAIDLYANGATSVFYDDISILPTFAIEVAKSPASQEIVTGGTATWTIDVTNVGVTDLTGVDTTDPLASDCDMTIGDLAAGGTYSFNCEETGVMASFTNTISVAGSVAGGSTVTDTAEAYVDVVPPTSVSLSSFGGSDSGSTWVLALAAGIVGAGVVLVLSRRRRTA